MKIFLLLMALSCTTATAQTAEEAPDPSSVESILGWQKSLGDWPWSFPAEYKVALHARQPKQLLLAISGGSKSGSYRLFMKQKAAWFPISDPIEQGHHEIEILAQTHQGWHSFETYAPLWGSGGKDVLVSRYAWNGKRYTLTSSRTDSWCSIPRFKLSYAKDLNCADH